MATPIKSTNTPGTPAVTGVSPAVNDLLTRLGGQGADGQSQKMAFSQWMDKHAISGAPLSEGAKSPTAAAAPTAAATNTSASTAAKMAEQALARSRQQALMANKSLEANKAAQTSQPEAKEAGKAAQAPRPAAAARKEGVKGSAQPKGDQDDGEDKVEEGGKEEVSFNTPMGEGSAVVRELTPPSTIQAGDSAGMMAWLASLTNGDLSHGKGAALAGDAEGGASSTARLQATDGQGGQDAALVDAKDASGKPGALTLDNPLWQGASANAGLQVEAMLGQSGKSGDSKAEIDPLAGLMAGGGIKASQFGANDAAQSVRHESATLPTPLNSPEFPQALAEKVGMWVKATGDDGTMTAELHLNPAEMGPINVKISLDGQTAQVDFAAAALETRKAIEASLPMLSSALSDVGLNMTGGDVSSQTAQQQFNQRFDQSPDQQGGSGRSDGASRGGDAVTGLDPAGMRPVQAPRAGRLGGLDLYA